MSDYQSLIEALASVQAKLPSIQKSKVATVPTKTGGSYSYHYADLADITNEVLPLLGAAGLAWVTMPTTDEGGFALHYRLLHSSGESLTGVYPLPDPAHATPQSIGSAITYARRYAFCSVVGIVPDEDDDAKAAENQGAKASPRKVVAQPQPQRETVRAEPTKTEPASPEPEPVHASKDGTEVVNLSKTFVKLTTPQRLEVLAVLNERNIQIAQVPAQVAPEVEALIQKAMAA